MSGPCALRAALLAQARAGRTITYGELAAQLDLQPPGAISRLGVQLETLMAEDAAAGRPLLAVLCIGRAGDGMPGRGFFVAARALGRYEGQPDGAEARSFHLAELFAACDYYGAGHERAGSR